MLLLRKLRTTAVVVLFLPAALASSQNRGMIFDHLSIPEGLSQGTVFSILQDRTGFMWFGTADGLNVFDGYTFTHYFHDVSDSSSISDNRVIALLEDRAGRLSIRNDRRRAESLRSWIRDVPPVSVGSGRQSQPERRPGELPFRGQPGNDLGRDNHRRAQRVRPATGRFRRFRHDPGDSTTLGSSHVFPIIEDREGTLWIGTPEGISLFDRESGTFRRIRSIPGIRTA